MGKSTNQLVGVLVGSLVGKESSGPVEQFFEGEVRTRGQCPMGHSVGIGRMLKTFRTVGLSRFQF